MKDNKYTIVRKEINGRIFCTLLNGTVPVCGIITSSKERADDWCKRKVSK